jgi:hypothetical protein
VVRAIACAVALAACYQPHEAPGVPCSDSLACPNGQLCDTRQQPPICVTVLVDAGPDTSDAPDAPDAATSNTCTTGADCASGACDELAGQCLAEAATLYVATTGADTGTCSRPAPCATVTYALTLIDPARHAIAVAGGTYNGNITVANPGTLSGPIVITGDPADRARFTGLTNLNVSGDVELEDIVVDGATGAAVFVVTSSNLVVSHADLVNSMGDGIRSTNSNPSTIRVLDSNLSHNANIGIHVGRGTLEVRRCNLSSNLAGGLLADSAVQITLTSSVLALDGSATSGRGGITMQNQATFVDFGFNTVAFNQVSSTATNAPALQCSNAAEIHDSIIFSNAGGTSPTQITGCTARYSLFDSTPLPGVGNLTGSAAFVDPAGNFHITAASSAHSTADQTATEPLDIDGQPRPQGQYDIGADEIPN